jgi:hypothetical protein
VWKRGGGKTNEANEQFKVNYKSRKAFLIFLAAHPIEFIHLKNDYLNYFQIS